MGLRRQGRRPPTGPRSSPPRAASTAAPRPSSGSRPTRRPGGGSGPFTPGFRTVPFGDADALAAAIDDTTAAVLHRAGPGRGRRDRPAARLPAGRPRPVRPPRRAAHRRRDPVGPRAHRAARWPATTRASGPTWCCWARRSAGASCPSRPSSARRDVIGTLDPGSHGSTFGGNPLACAVAREVLALLRTGEPQRAAAALGAHLAARLGGAGGDWSGRGRPHHGLWAGIDLTEGGAPPGPPASDFYAGACW